MQSAAETTSVHRVPSGSSSSLKEKKHADPEQQEAYLAKDTDTEVQTPETRTHSKYRHFILGGLALLILGWWISATILKATRHRWYVLAS